MASNMLDEKGIQTKSLTGSSVQPINETVSSATSRLTSGEQQTKSLPEEYISLPQVARKVTAKPSPPRFTGFDIAPLLPAIELPTTRADDQAQRVLRAHFAKHILEDLKQIQKHCGEPTAAVYADNIMRAIRSMRDRSPNDPFLEVVMALHDAMAYKHRWADYTANQYNQVFLRLSNLINKGSLSKDDIENSIEYLDSIGFDSLPFEIEFDLDLEITNEEE
jgi:hypothetical protein